MHSFASLAVFPWRLVAAVQTWVAVPKVKEPVKRPGRELTEAASRPTVLGSASEHHSHYQAEVENWVGQVDSV